jgi:hypothetical protein
MSSFNSTLNHVYDILNYMQVKAVNCIHFSTSLLRDLYSLISNIILHHSYWRHLLLIILYCGFFSKNKGIVDFTYSYIYSAHNNIISSQALIRLLVQLDISSSIHKWMQTFVEFDKHFRQTFASIYVQCRIFRHWRLIKISISGWFRPGKGIKGY